MEKTKNYEMFRFIEGNREIDERHVEHLKEEIKANNLLFAKPIDVNKEFGVIDGQHRLLAAKSLGVEIYYNKHENLQKHDMIVLNRAQRNWVLKDYLNYYVSQGYDDYIMLRDFAKQHELSINVAVAICDQWRSMKAGTRFKDGQFVFNKAFDDELIYKAKEIKNLIKTKLGDKPYLRSCIFLKSLCILLSTVQIDYKTLKSKVEMQLPKITGHTNLRNYITMFLDIYNYRSKSKGISIEEIEI